MKRTFTLLLIIVVVLYAKEACRIYQSAMYVTEQLTGSLSDITEELTAIPLQPADGYRIDKARSIRQEGANLFLISKGVLYRFQHNGDFICRITNPEDINVAGYMVDSVKKELIVLGNQEDVFYYDFEGQLIERKKLNSELPNRQILAMSLHSNRIWSIEENSYQDPDTQEIYIEKEVVTYDTSFHKIETRKLVALDLGRPQFMLGLFEPRLCLDPSSGNPLVHYASPYSEQLPMDTLYLKNSWEKQTATIWNSGKVPVTPVNPMGRFWISSYQNMQDDKKNYTFCFDTQTYQYKNIEGGLRDDFYNTGDVVLEAMDMYNNSYCYVKSGKDIKKAFPGRKEEENAVVFIVKLKQV